MSPKSPCAAFLLGWLVPGAGHWYLGQRARAAALAGSLGGGFLAGVVMGGGSVVREDRPEYLVIQAGAGLPAALGYAVGRGPMPDVPVSRRDLALLYTLVPALVNLVAALDAAARAAGMGAGAGAGTTHDDAPTAEPAAAAAPPPDDGAVPAAEAP